MKILIVAGALMLVLVVAGIAYLQHPKFGPAFDAESLEGASNSPQFANGQFNNLEPTQVLLKGESTLSIIWKGIVNRRPAKLRPELSIPTRKTDLHALDRDTDLVIWLGHSSYFVQLGGQRILIDPVLSRYAAPVPLANEAFEGTRLYDVDEIPPIDVLLITHDHWDHLDYPSIDGLRDRVREVVTPLGVDRYFLAWGFEPDRVHARDWFGSVRLDPDLTVYVLPARHYSGRLLAKSKTQWASFALETPERRLYFGGDSGYGKHVGQIAAHFDDFDLAVLDMGQYDPRWPSIHMTPEEAARTAQELGARALLPAHVGKFTIANHAWDEPFERIVAASRNKPYRLLTPLMGEPVALQEVQTFGPWWREITAETGRAQ